MPVLNPWLQRLLIGLLGGTATGGVVVASAKNRYAPKKRKKRQPREQDVDDDGNVIAREKRAPPVIAIGTVAKADAAEGFVPSLTWSQWAQGVRDRGRRLVDGLLGRSKKPVVDGDGARLADEVLTADGRRSSPAKTARKTAAKTPNGKVKKKTAARGKRGRRKQATLFESAKESLRQVVKEEVKKTVDDTVEQTGLKGAVDTIKQATDNVGETVKDVGQKIKDALPEDAGEKIQLGARSLFEGAKKQAARLRDSIQGAIADAEAERLADREHAALLAQRQQAADENDVVIDMIDGEPNTQLPQFAATTASDDDASSALTIRAPSDLAVINDAVVGDAASDVKEGMSAEDVATVVVDKVSGGVQKLGSFLVGPGHPDYRSSKSKRQISGEVVQAKDPPPPKSSSST